MRLRLAAAAALLTAVAAADPTTRLQWDHLPPIVRERLAARGIDRDGFPAALARIDEETAARLHEGDWEALVYYALQSTSFTDRAPVEPALSAKAHHARSAVPMDARARLERLADVLGADPGQRPFSATAGPVLRADRLEYFRTLVARDPRAAQQGAQSLLMAEYARVMRFLYETEYGEARRQAEAAGGAAPPIYHARGHSTDTAVEAGYGVHQALGVIRSHARTPRVRRVLVVGPGLTLARRTGFVDEVPPQSYQPYAVLDDLVSLGFARLADVRIDCVDVNPRVVAHLETLRTAETPPPPLLLVAGAPDRLPTPLTPDYREYFDGWGGAVGLPAPAPALPDRLADHPRRAVALSRAARARVYARRASILTDRVGDAPYDLVVATNVLTYFDDLQLGLALANIASLIAPDGYLVHNETRDALVDLAEPVGLPIVHTRTVVFTQASSDGSPLYDRIWVHRGTQTDSDGGRR